MNSHERTTRVKKIPSERQRYWNHELPNEWTIKTKPDPQPKTSWWLNLSREELHTAIQAEAERMAREPQR